MAVIGKLFKKSEADALFGAVTASAAVNSVDLAALIDQAGNDIMFKLVNGNLIVLGEGRKVLYPEGAVVSDSDVFARFSSSKASELLSTGVDDNVYVEQRGDTTTINYGDNILEDGVNCPPICW